MKSILRSTSCNSLVEVVVTIQAVILVREKNIIFLFHPELQLRLTHLSSKKRPKTRYLPSYFLASVEESLLVIGSEFSVSNFRHTLDDPCG